MEKTSGDISGCTMQQGESRISGRQYVGGFIGRNEGGNLDGLTNNVDVEGVRQVGGIAGVNKNSIKNGKNSGKINGKTSSVSEISEGDIGGIIGYQTDGKIERCENNGEVKGYNSQSVKITTEYSTATGIGGIVGRVSGSNVMECNNNSTINGNFGLGGIAGLAQNTVIDSCFNCGIITNSSMVKKATGGYTWNIIGGICGNSRGCTIITSYNKGEIKGANFESASKLYYKQVSATGGIVGLCGKKDESSRTTINYCYNCGSVTGGNEYEWFPLNEACIGGIVGNIAENCSLIGTGNYCLTNKINYTARHLTGNLNPDKTVHKGAVNGFDTTGFTGLNELKLRYQLYNWATKNSAEGGLFKDSNYVYYTTCPVKIDIGYNGFGVLYWQLEDQGYFRRTIYVCDNKGKAIYEPKLHIGGNDVQLYDENNTVTYNGTNISYKGKDIHGYTLVLNSNYDCYATATDYSESNHENSSTDGILLNLGVRPSFIYARDKSSDEYTISIPEGNYYVIMAGGRRPEEII